MPANSDVSRRSVLKRAAGVAAGTGLLASTSGLGAAAPTAEVGILTTEPYEERYGDANAKLYDVSDYCYNTWQEYLEGSAHTNTYGPTVPADALETNDIYLRANAADNWLGDSWVYESYDAFVVLDYATDDDLEFNSPGYSAGVGTAGTNDDKTAIVNAWYEDENQYDIRTHVGLEGSAFHELGHLFNGLHTEAEVMGDRASLMFVQSDDQAPTCGGNNDQDAVEEIGHWLSPCNIGQINDYAAKNI